MPKNGSPDFQCLVHQHKVNCIDCFIIEAHELNQDVKFCENLVKRQNEIIEERDAEIHQLRRKLSQYKDLIEEFKEDYQIHPYKKDYPRWLKRHFVMEELLERIRIM
jgi:hypothetical protein